MDTVHGIISKSGATAVHLQLVQYVDVKLIRIINYNYALWPILYNYIYYIPIVYCKRPAK
jgi:hypothetical protein